MALCFAHTTAGYLVYEATRPAGRHRPGLLFTAVALANGADADFLPGIAIGDPGLFHRGFSHTVAAVAVIGFAGWLVGRRWAPPGWTALRAASWAAAVYATHLVLDFFTIDSHPPAGAPFLWPFLDANYISPVTPLREIIIDPSGRLAFFKSLVQPHTIPVWAEEVSILLAGLALPRLIRRVRAALADSPEAVAGIAEPP
jgi:membrane-bound metal-dependent hydrolase YbcI (DUF457 family)